MESNTLENLMSQGFSEEIKKFNEEQEQSESSEERVKPIEQENVEEEVQEEVQEEETQDAPSTFEMLAQELGYEDDFSQYEESPEGLLSFVKDYTSKKEQEIEDNVYKYIEHEHPVIAEILNKAYTTNKPATDIIKEYYEVLNFEELNIDTTDTESLREVVRQQMQNTGYFTPDEIENKLDTLQDTGQLYDKAKPIIDSYNQNQLQYRNQVLQREQYKLQELENKAKMQGERLLSLLENRKLETITIPDKDVEPFAEFLNNKLSRDNEGNLYAKTYFNSLSDIETEFIKYRGGVTKIKDLVGMKANTELAKKLFTSKKSSQKDDVNEGFNRIFGHLK